MWGGGIYQPSDELTGGYDFYSICDELGIFAWSELIFSDSTYPTNDFFLKTVEPEVRQNIRRINRHPSNAQWAGSNEIEVILLYLNATNPSISHYLDEVCVVANSRMVLQRGLRCRTVPDTLWRLLARRCLAGAILGKLATGRLACDNC